MPIWERTLHLTNGAAIHDKIKAAGAKGPIVEWLDMLHEGPVPAGLGPAALREQRAAFLAGCGWASHDAIMRQLDARDLALDEAIAGGDEIVLWFEHDLFDQLHLIQILDRIPVDGLPQVTAVQPATYLGHHAVEDFPGLLQGRRPVSSAQRLAARDAWQAFRSSDPRAIVDALPRITALPHLAPALRRHLEQFPSTRNGLSRTEQQTLEVVAERPRSVHDVFARVNLDREEAMFMGDSAFVFHVSSLTQNSRPLLHTVDGRLQLTDEGGRVMRGELDRIEICGLDRWLGGVHLAAQTTLWRWDPERLTVRDRENRY